MDEEQYEMLSDASSCCSGKVNKLDRSYCA